MKKLFKVAFVLLLVLSGMLSYSDERAINPVTTRVMASEDQNGIFTVKNYTIDWQHWLLHAGYLYRYKDTTLNLAADSTDGFVILTPTSDEAPLHITLQTDGSGESSIFIYEGITGDVGAEISTVYFLNRNSTRTRNSTFYEIGSAIGTLLLDPNKYGQQKKSGGGDFSQELLCKPSTYYLFLIRSDAAGGNYTYTALGYEKD